LLPVVVTAFVAILIRVAAMRPSVLHEDEALYASYGFRVAREADFLLLGGGFALDRPPLLFWIIGATIGVLGDSPVAIRFPNLVFAGVTVAAVCLLARVLGSSRTGSLLAGGLFALSPYAIAFGPTVFEEPGAVALATVALVLAASRHPTLAGVTLGLAVWIKLMAVSYFPVALALLLLIPAQRLPATARYVAGFAAIVGGLFALMAIRTVVFDAEFFLALQYEHIGGVGIVHPGDWLDRAGQWLYWTGLFAVGPAVALCAIGLAFALVGSVLRRQWGPIVLATFVIGYFLLITIAQLPIYDRYVFWLLPPLAVSVAIGWDWAVRRILRSRKRGWVPVVAAILTIAILWPSASVAIRGGYPVAGSGQRTYDGYQQICSWLASRGSSNDIVWNQSLNWHFAYCLASAQIKSYWYPDAAAVADVGTGTYLALTEVDDRGVVDALREEGWCASLVQEFFASDGRANMWVYALEPPADVDTLCPSRADDGPGAVAR
jgi:4-amino-4-deoxy-L-arabinose transferase-like glycosyltransferase